MDLVVDITADGKVEAMYSDGFNLGFLGPQNVRRASNIVFDAETQSWSIDILSKDGRSRSVQWGFATYEGARQYEIAYLNECRLQGVDPMGPAADDWRSRPSPAAGV